MGGWRERWEEGRGEVPVPQDELVIECKVRRGGGRG